MMSNLYCCSPHKNKPFLCAATTKKFSYKNVPKSRNFRKFRSLSLPRPPNQRTRLYIMNRFLPGSASKGFVQIDKDCTFADCMKSLGVRGAARAYAGFVNNMFGPPSWKTESKEGAGSDTTLPSHVKGRVYIPLSFVVSPTTPLYMMTNFRIATPPKEHPETGDARCTMNHHRFIEEQLTLLKRGRDLGNGVRLVPPSTVDKTLRAPEGSASRFSDAALRIVQFAHMFQRPDVYCVSRQTQEGGDGEVGARQESFVLFYSLVEAARSIAIVAREDDIISHTGPVSFLGDWVDRAIGDAGNGQPDPFLASAIECACYMVGREPGPFSAEERGAEGTNTSEAAAPRDVLRAAAAVLGCEAHRAASELSATATNGEEKTPLSVSPDWKKAFDIASQVARSNVPPQFACTSRMLHLWTKTMETDRNTQNETSFAARAHAPTSAAREALARMPHLIQFALSLTPGRARSVSSASVERQVEVNDSDMTETDS